MSFDGPIGWLIGMTLLAVLAIGIWQFVKVRGSREERGEHGHVSHPPPDSDTPRNRPP